MIATTLMTGDCLLVQYDLQRAYKLPGPYLASFLSALHTVAALSVLQPPHPLLHQIAVCCPMGNSGSKSICSDPNLFASLSDNLPQDEYAQYDYVIVGGGEVVSYSR